MEQNRSKQARTIHATLSATTNFYNGVKAHLVRHASATYILQPMARKTYSIHTSQGEQERESALAMDILPTHLIPKLPSMILFPSFCLYLYILSQSLVPHVPPPPPTPSSVSFATLDKWEPVDCLSKLAGATTRLFMSANLLHWTPI